jgi:hypothetical protein
VSKSRAAIERAQEAEGKKKNKAHGRYFIAEPRVMDGGEMPTRKEWLEEQEQKRGAIAQKPFSPREPHIIQGKK